MSHTNDVTLFSNGIGHFRRVYDIPAGEQQKISIPFKRDHIGDVAASLQVFGDVKLDTPPSFTPTNSNATALRIDASDAMHSMLRSLSGAKVKVSAGTEDEYTLVGVDEETRYTASGNIEESVLVLMNHRGIQRKYLKDVKDIQFMEESVRTEIEKALKNNFQQIKPDSTLLDICLSATSEATQAHIQYTIPVAAWKMRYTLHQEGSKSFRIEGAAIIDNNTDEDWKNFMISVVTGNPISFNTDIAEVVVPQRRMVRLVDGAVLGNVDVEEGSLTQYASGDSNLMGVRGLSASNTISPSVRMSKCSVSNRADFGMAPRSVAGSDPVALYEAAQGPVEIESREVGDFSIFSSKQPITILARKSAVVPMFSAPLEQAGAVLLYKERNHSNRPYRAVKFKNETEYSLGKGKTLIYNKGVFSGECILQTTKPGENRMLPHCLENGVKIKKEAKSVEIRKNSIRISDGTVFEESISTAATAYVITNKKDEMFKMAMEHESQLGVADTKVFFDGVEIVEQEKLDYGWRLYFEIKPKETLSVGVLETSVNHQKFVMHNTNWLRGAIISIDHPLGDDTQIKKCMEIQEKIDQFSTRGGDLNTKSSQKVSQADRLRKNIEATREVASDQVKIWVSDLAMCETAIQNIETTLMPELQVEMDILNLQLSAELKKIKANWRDQQGPEPAKKG